MAALENPVFSAGKKSARKPSDSAPAFTVANASVSPPWLGIATSASADWSTKDLRGREVRVAFELHTRGSDTAVDGALVTAIDKRVEAIPQAQDGFTIVTARFLRARAERRARNLRVVLLEYSFRLLETA